ncbi:hypothetical protein SALBM311S_05971 [Streptomyces alboniger]
MNVEDRGQRAGGARRFLDQGVDAAAGALHPHVLHGDGPRGFHAGRVQDGPTRRRADRRRFGGRGPEVLHAAVRAGRRPGDRARRGRDLDPLPGRQVVAEELAAGLEAVRDQQAGAVRVPLGAHVTGQVQGEVGLLAGRHVPHQGLPAAPALVADQQPGVAVHRSEAEDLQAEFLGAALGVVEVGDRCAVGAHDAQRRVHRVAVLGVLDGDQRAVVREVADARGLAVAVDLHGLLAEAGDMDRRAVLVGGAAHDRGTAVPGEGQSRRVRRLQARRGEVVRPALEGLTAPDPELVAVLVVEPPHPPAVRGEHAVRRAVRPVGHLALLTRRSVPGVQLVGPRRVRHEQGAVRRVLRPVGQGHPGRPEALLPVRHVRHVLVPLGRGGPLALSHDPILPAPTDNAPTGPPACG